MAKNNYTIVDVDALHKQIFKNAVFQKEKCRIVTFIDEISSVSVL